MAPAGEKGEEKKDVKEGWEVGGGKGEVGEEEGGEGREDVKGGCWSVTEGGVRGGEGREDVMEGVRRWR